MNWRAPLSNWLNWLWLAPPALAYAYFHGGPLGVAGMAIGIAATLFSLLALSWAISVIARPSTAPEQSRLRTAFIYVCFLLKLPLIVGAMTLVQRWDGAAPGHFIGGLLLVYFALVGWGFAKGEPV